MLHRFGPSALLVTLACACADGPATPRALPDVTVTSQVVYAGDEATIASDVRFVPTGARVAIGGDTVPLGGGAESETYSFRVPALRTGTYEATLLVDGHAVPFGIQVVGLAREPRGVAGGYWITIRNLYSADGGQAFIAEPNGLFYGRDAQGAYGLIDVFAGTYAMQIPGLVEDGIQQVKMSVPGASYRPNHVVFDYSAEGTSDARVWRTRPSFEPGESLPCGYDAPGYAQYTVAEISPSVCLSLRDDEVWRNGSERVVRFPSSLNAQFRVAPGGAHTLLVRVPPVRSDEPAVDWPVFDASGRITYTLSGYVGVTGAAFSRDGATIWIVGRTADGTWRLDALDAMTGDVQQSRAFPGVEALLDVVQGRLDDRLYVASTGLELIPSLHVLAPDGLTVEHSIPAPGQDSCPRVFDGGFLVPGGSDGRIHLVGASGQECGWWIWSFDRR